MISIFKLRPVSMALKPSGLRFISSTSSKQSIMDILGSVASERKTNTNQSGGDRIYTSRSNFGPSRTANAEPEKLPEDGKLRVGYVLHCKFTSNNTIITLTSQYRRVGKLAEKLSASDKYLDQVKPREDVVINLSAGLVGFRNTKQGEYEAGFQTAKRMFELMNERKLLNLPIEIIMSNFGKGREAFINALNGSEGNTIRPSISRVTDGTKIKIGGVREPRARRV